MNNRSLLKQLFASVLCLLSVSCIQDLGYDQEDFDPYSARRNPHVDLLGFYIDNKEYIQDVAYLDSIFGSGSPYCEWYIMNMNGEDVLLVSASIHCVDGSELESEDESLLFLRGIWLCLPWRGVVNGQVLTATYPNNEIGVRKSDITENSFIVYGKNLPIESLSVRYVKITNNEIEAQFTGEVYLDYIKDQHRAIISQGIIHINRDRNYYGTETQSYNSWMNSFDRQNYCEWPE